MFALDLGRCAVFLDYDGTISTADTCVHLLERLAAPGWKAIAAQYGAGEIGSRDALRAEWALLPADEGLLRATAAEVALDPGVDELVWVLLVAGAEVTIISDGYGFYLDDQIGRLGVPVITNSVNWSSGELEFAHSDLSCPCASCGTCKQAPIREANARGRTTVLVGDGTSDRKAAAVADVVFAKDGLARWCTSAGVAFFPFECLDDVRASLVAPSTQG